MSQEIIGLMFKAVFVCICSIFTYVIVPYIKSKLDDDKWEKLQSYTEYAVRCAEQMFTEEEWKQKKQYVTDYIYKKMIELGLNMGEKDVDILIEGIVNLIKHDSDYEKDI